MQNTNLKVMTKHAQDLQKSDTDLVITNEPENMAHFFSFENFD